MKILVTGNMGYLGPVVIHQLLASHPEAILVGFDTGFYGHCLTGRGALPECRVHVQYFADIRQIPEASLSGVDVVVHLAAISNDPIGNRFEETTLDINHRSSIDLARKARDSGARSFVFASSCSMYGEADDAARTERAPLLPLTAYARSKVLAERDLEPLASRRFLITSLRFSTACGWSDRLRLDLVLNDFVAGAVASGQISILSDGTPWRPLIHVKDMARAIDWAILRTEENGGQFLAVNVGSDSWNYQVMDLARAVAEEITGTEVTVNPAAQPDRRSYKVDFSLFRKLAPDFQPRVDLSESIRELKTGLEAIGFKDREFRRSRYMRLNVLGELRGQGILDDRLCWTRR